MSCAVNYGLRKIVVCSDFMMGLLKIVVVMSSVVDYGL